MIKAIKVFYSPGLISIDERGKQGSQICTGADGQKNHRQQTLKVEYRTLKGG